MNVEQMDHIQKPHCFAILHPKNIRNIILASKLIGLARLLVVFLGRGRIFHRSEAARISRISRILVFYRERIVGIDLFGRDEFHMRRDIRNRRMLENQLLILLERTLTLVPI